MGLETEHRLAVDEDFTARRYASAAYAVVVCPSVRPVTDEVSVLGRGVSVDCSQECQRERVVGSLSDLNDRRAVDVPRRPRHLAGAVGRQQRVPDGQLGHRQRCGLVERRVAGHVGGAQQVLGAGRRERQQGGDVVDGVGADGLVQRRLGQESVANVDRRAVPYQQRAQATCTDHTHTHTHVMCE